MTTATRPSPTAAAPRSRKAPKRAPAPAAAPAPTTANAIYVNLPVADLRRSVDFFTALGFAFNPQFTDDTATCMLLGSNMCAMLLTHAKFASFSPNPVSDAHRATEVFVCLSLASRAQVDDLVRRAAAAGGRIPKPADDHGWMYGHAFQDLDGHVWELVYMDAAALAAQLAQGGTP